MSTKVTETSTQFDKLVGDLETLHKALPKEDDTQDDEKIEAAKKGGAETEEDDEGTEDEVKEVKKDTKKKPLAKSLSVTLEDGTVVEAEDGTELVKSLTEAMGVLTARVESFETHESVIAKSLGQAVDLLKAQSAQIAGLQAQVKAIAGEGRGRKAVVNLLEKTATLAKGGQTDGISPNDFMAKAESQFKAGKLAGTDLAFIESAFNRGQYELPPALVSKVTAA